MMTPVVQAVLVVPGNNDIADLVNNGAQGQAPLGDVGAYVAQSG
eukprot:CAMPEP_0180519426 /NCGR_PEP_ID=MMETSP1036_2-20121128/55682_1 /TAXON_ID=632150 /ORGANISM="Azadinium spinosum, Strain 3D9" /LENGTH=43 /DNA_ID= /DNA_START= /DNA_END= /DNA_ORIENTATION=